ncbi:methionyl-tRNA formyltransferase [Clostridia bacterium]|nr:methionyl-tRNA formyltransferase [Clostridia bacterium]
MKIAFMGTPDFAVPALSMLFDSEHEVTHVFTQPDRPKNRGKKLAPSDVKLCALSSGLAEDRIIQPRSLRKGEDAEPALELLKAAAPDLIVVAAYGQILPAGVLAVPRLGCVNIHASLLPKYRGASPMNACIRAGDRETGVTLMYMAEGLDTGDMIASCKVAVGGGTNAGELSAVLSVAGANLLRETLPAIENGTAPRIPQDDRKATYAGLIKKEDSHINFAQSAVQVHNDIRGLPAPYTFINGRRVKILKSDVRGHVEGEAGQIARVGSEMIVVCENGSVALLEIAPEGKKHMSGSDFLNGQNGVVSVDSEGVEICLLS